MNPKLCNICGKRPCSKNQGTCSQCRWKKHSAKQTKRIATPEYKEQLKQWRRTRTISAAAKQREIRHRANYAAKYPDKERAKRLLNRAILAGKVVRPIICPQCKRSDRARDGRSLIQAHHDDYSKPLEVRWLCIQCHSDHHRALKEK